MMAWRNRAVLNASGKRKRDVRSLWLRRDLHFHASEGGVGAAA